jgi:isoleucyl-tRNA synthetase
VAALDAQSAAARLRSGEMVGVSIDGTEHSLGPDDVQLVLQPLEGYQLERAGTHAVALNLELDEELRREGLAREVVHSVQAARKAAGLEVSDSIALTLTGDAELIAAARTHERYVAGETLAAEVSFDGADAAEGADDHTARVDGRELRIAVERVGARS